SLPTASGVAGRGRKRRRHACPASAPWPCGHTSWASACHSISRLCPHLRHGPTSSACPRPRRSREGQPRLRSLTGLPFGCSYLAAGGALARFAGASSCRLIELAQASRSSKKSGGPPFEVCPRRRGRGNCHEL